jgi:phosphonate transport system substrate-binding protein
MKGIMRTFGIAAVAMTISSSALWAAQTALNFGIISTETTTNLKDQWEPFLADMSAKTGIKINAFYASDYAGIIEGMKFGKVQVAWYGNKSAMEAVDRADGEVFAQTVDKEGNPGYWSVLITQASNNAINNLDDAMKCDKSLTFGNGDPNSTSGFLVPSVFVFTAKGVEPKDCFKAVTNANHEANIMAVAQGQVDVATNNTESLRRIKEEKPEIADKLKVIWQSPLIPLDPIVWREDLDAETKAKLMTFFMTYGRLGTTEQVAAEREKLKALGWAPFKPSSDAQLYPIRILEAQKAMNKVAKDETMSQAEKDAKIKELEATKARFEKLMVDQPQS